MPIDVLIFILGKICVFVLISTSLELQKSNGVEPDNVHSNWGNPLDDGKPGSGKHIVYHAVVGEFLHRSLLAPDPTDK